MRIRRLQAIVIENERSKPIAAAPISSRSTFRVARCLAQCVARPGGYNRFTMDFRGRAALIAHTLAHWRSRFEGASAKVARLIDERFRRCWSFYLAYCEGASSRQYRCSASGLGSERTG